MDNRWRRSVGLVMVVVAFGLTFGLTSVPGSPAVEEVGAATTCAVPDDCRLWEAASGVGIRFGLATVNGSAQHKATLLAEADVSVNHEFSWSGIEPDRGVWDFSKADDNYQFAVDHGLHQIAMHFAWDQLYLDDLPGWVAGITDPDELRDVLRIRAETIFARYPELDRIDVINEPFQTLGSTLYENHFHTVLGADYIHELFAIVEAAAPPTVELFVNEAGIEFQPDKAAALVSLIADLKAAGRRVDAVGLQTHLSVGEPNWQVLYDTMRQLAALGVRPFISEIDVPVPASVPDRDAVQAERYRRATVICLSVPLCDTVNVWGVSDADTWYDWALYPDLDPMLFDEAYEPKPSYEAVRRALLDGRPDPDRIPDFLTTTTSVRTSGNEPVTYALECVAAGPVTEIGYGEIAHVTHLFLAGNPIRLPLTGTVTWSPRADASGSIDYSADLALDLGELARLSREETARPAVGLGGHLDLVDTVWLELLASELRLAFPTPAGTTVVGGQPVVAVATASGDSRAPGDPLRLATSWNVHVDVPRPAGVVTLGAPTLTFGLEAHLGVVFQGLEVYGGTIGAMQCTAVADVPTLATTVGVAAAPAVVAPAFTG